MSQLKSKIFHTKIDINRKAYSKRRNLCVSLAKCEKKKFFNNIGTPDVIDNKTFSKTVKPLFTDKVQTKPKIILLEKKLFPGQARTNSF